MNRQSNANRETEGSLPVSTPQSATAAVPGAPGGDKFAELKNAIVNLIKNTAWTGNSSEAQQRLLKTVNNLANPANNSAQVSGEYKVLVEEIINVLEHVRSKLEGGSAKYGNKNLGTRDKIKHLSAHLDRNGSIEILEACRTDIETVIGRLQVAWIVFGDYPNLLI
ncbi:hypothetical protein FRC05_004765 [Tulasnella sp. 425]|nr:hypothetical protein FRC05_004765 [Tulasnella sp. 425]